MMSVSQPKKRIYEIRLLEYEYKLRRRKISIILKYSSS